MMSRTGFWGEKAPPKFQAFRVSEFELTLPDGARPSNRMANQRIAPLAFFRRTINFWTRPFEDAAPETVAPVECHKTLTSLIQLSHQTS
jgi:hypothetical protein